MVQIAVLWLLLWPVWHGDAIYRVSTSLLSLPDPEDRGPSTVLCWAISRYKNFIWFYDIDIQWTGEFFAKLQTIPAHPSDNRL